MRKSFVRAGLWAGVLGGVVMLLRVAAVQESPAEVKPGETQYQLGVLYDNKHNHQEAVKWYRKAAEQGHAKAQYELGEAYANGEGVLPQSDQEAVKWYHKAAEQGVAKAQYELGEAYAKGEGVPENDEEAVKWYRKAAEQGHAKAQYELGQAYRLAENKHKAEKLYRMAAEQFRKAAEQGHVESQLYLGFGYDYGWWGLPVNDQEAVKWYSKAAGQEHADAQARLGEMYRDGQGVMKEYQEAVKWFRKAAEQGHAESQLYLGEMYRDGKGVPQNDAEAYFWAILAMVSGSNEADELCDLVAERLTYEQRVATWDRVNTDAPQWDARSQRIFNLGMAYDYGWCGLPVDDQEAVKWYRMAAEQGDSFFVQRTLALMYRDGQGVLQNYQEAAKWFRKAAEQGDNSAQESLGEMYRDGQGVPQNDAEAYFWLLLGSVNGDENRAKARDTVAQRLTPEQRAAVQNRAAAWRPSKPE